MQESANTRFNVLVGLIREVRPSLVDSVQSILDSLRVTTAV